MNYCFRYACNAAKLRSVKIESTSEIANDCGQRLIVNMADSDFLITISGPALSLLFYENVRSTGDQVRICFPRLFLTMPYHLTW